MSDAAAQSTPPATDSTAGSTEAELIAIRREKLGRMRELGVDAYGGRYEVTHKPEQL